VAVPDLQAAEKSGGVNLHQYLQGFKYGFVPIQGAAESKPLINAKIGDRSVRLLLDSGCGWTTLDTETAKGLKTLEELGVVLQDSLFGELTNRDIVVVEKLILSKAQFFNQPARVRKLEMDYTTMDCNGILGLDFLVRNHCLIDWGEKRLYFRGSELSTEESSTLSESLRRSGLIEVELEVKKGGWCVTKAKVNEQVVWLAIDTGAFLTVLDQAQAKRFALTPMRHSRPATGSLIPDQAKLKAIGVGKIGMHEGRVAMFDHLQVATREWKNVQCAVVDLTPWFKGPEGSTQLQEELPEGLLGRDFFTSQRTLIDFANGKLWLAPQAKNK
jgi:hypothetical protein